ncbi:Glycine-rich RNA-binding protein RZ1C-like protein [Drosera capensis]
MSAKDIENRVFVGGLSGDVTERDLEDAFRRFGEVVDCQIIKLSDLNLILIARGGTQGNIYDKMLLGIVAQLYSSVVVNFSDSTVRDYCFRAGFPFLSVRLFELWSSDLLAVLNSAPWICCVETVKSS